MNKAPFTKRILAPVLAVLIVMAISHFAYYRSRAIDNQSAHLLIANISGTLYFISIVLGSFFVYTITKLRGASRAESILSCFVTPFVWATAGVLTILQSHTIPECLYWYLNPLNIWLISFMVLEMGAAELTARAVLKKRGANIKIITPGPLVAISVSLFFAVSMFMWGRGENMYVIFLEGYRRLFGSGL